MNKQSINDLAPTYIIIYDADDLIAVCHSEVRVAEILEEDILNNQRAVDDYDIFVSTEKIQATLQIKLTHLGDK
jgi:hypothetical protein